MLETFRQTRKWLLGCASPESLKNATNSHKNKSRKKNAAGQQTWNMDPNQVHTHKNLKVIFIRSLNWVRKIYFIFRNSGSGLFTCFPARCRHYFPWWKNCQNGLFVSILFICFIINISRTYYFVLRWHFIIMGGY